MEDNLSNFKLSNNLIELELTGDKEVLIFSSLYGFLDKLKIEYKEKFGETLSMNHVLFLFSGLIATKHQQGDT